jgi:Man1-Src1p-C-terminal domain
LAHKTPNLTWNCALTVKSREMWSEWRSTVLGECCLIRWKHPKSFNDVHELGFIVTIAVYYTSKHYRARSVVENRRVAELVQIALDTLRNQELAHHTDPIIAPQPYLSSLQLRDVILQDEHSISERRKLWDKVERVVEGNANVRTNLEEVRGGDEMRVWRWVGGSGLRKRLQLQGE